ncbi:MAG: tRNA (adenosine(37)-N6)-threonylcarbamoyltransferase complex transferase subunit TsaD, partial [Anaerolineales bacterium]
MSENVDQDTRILGIETSCDETAASVVENGRRILSSVIASQVDLHAPYGGVFPELASRAHIEKIHPVVSQALSEAHTGLESIDAIAVTRGPGLAGSLVVGVNMAKGMAMGAGLPLLGINHLEAHLYSIWLVEDQPEP